MADETQREPSEVEKENAARKSGGGAKSAATRTASKVVVSNDKHRHTILALGSFVCLIILFAVFIWQLPRICQYESEALTFSIYVVVGLIAAVLLFGVLWSSGSFKGSQYGLTFEFGGPAALAVLVSAGGLGYEYINKEKTFSFSVYFYLDDKPQETVSASGTITLHLDEPKTVPINNGFASPQHIPSRWNGREVSYSVQLSGLALSSSSPPKLPLHRGSQVSLTVTPLLQTPVNAHKASHCAPDSLPVTLTAMQPLQDFVDARATEAMSYDELLLSANESFESVFTDANHPHLGKIVPVMAPAGTGKSKIARYVAEHKYPDKVHKVSFDNIEDDIAKLVEKGALGLGFWAIRWVATLDCSHKAWDFKMPLIEISRSTLLQYILATGYKSQPILIIDGLDEIHPHSASMLLQTLVDMRESDDSQLPKTVFVFGRAEGFMSYYIDPRKKGTTVLSDPVELRFPAISSRAEAELFREDYNRWARGGSTIGPKGGNRFVQILSGRPNLRDTTRFLFPANCLLETAELWPAKGNEDEEIMAAVFDSMLRRNSKTHKRPAPDGVDGEAYKNVLAILAGRSVVAADPETGFFQVNSIGGRPIAGAQVGLMEVECVSFNEAAFLNFCGVTELRPASFNRPSYRFVPNWLHGHLVNRYNRLVNVTVK